MEDWPKAAARCFATTSALDDGVSYSVGPLSTTFYNDDDRGYRNFCEDGKGHLLQPGQWAVLLVHEAFDAESQEALEKRELPAASMWGPRGTEGQKEWPVADVTRSFTPQKRLRYAFAKAVAEPGHREQRFLLTDARGYLQHAAQTAIIDRVSQWWNKNTGQGIDYYDEPDANALMQRIYSDEGFAIGAPSRARPVDPFEDIMRMMTELALQGRQCWCKQLLGHLSVLCLSYYETQINIIPQISHT